MDRWLESGIPVPSGYRVNCLICTLNPITRADFDGLCVSCRASVASGLYRVVWLERELEGLCANGEPSANLQWKPHPVTDFARRPRRRFERYRVIEFVTRAEDILGFEFPNHHDPIPYLPEFLPELWKALDTEKREYERAERILKNLEGV